MKRYLILFIAYLCVSITITAQQQNRHHQWMGHSISDYRPFEPKYTKDYEGKELKVFRVLPNGKEKEIPSKNYFLE